MLAEQLYDPGDGELTALRVKARKMARRYNQTDEDEPEKQQFVVFPGGPFTAQPGSFHYRS